MNTLSSQKFRIGYARLEETTLVTVNGHRLGVWLTLADAARLGFDFGQAIPAPVAEEIARNQLKPLPYRAVRPVPKPGKRK